MLWPKDQKIIHKTLQIMTMLILKISNLLKITFEKGLLWSYGCWIYNYLCNQCLSPLKLWVRTLFIARCTRYNIIWWSLSVACDSGFLLILWFPQPIKLTTTI